MEVNLKKRVISESGKIIFMFIIDLFICNIYPKYYSKYYIYPKYFPKYYKKFNKKYSSKSKKISN